MSKPLNVFLRSSLAMTAAAVAMSSLTSFADDVTEEASPLPPPPVAASAPAPTLPAPIVEFQNRQNYSATIVHSLDEVQRLFDMERALDHGSQCHERAEVWSNDINRLTNYNLMKVMMFYTPRFRQEFTSSGVFKDTEYKWWYHTAPVVYADINNGQGPMPYVLDAEFARQPMTLNDWSYHFLHTLIYGEGTTVPRARDGQRILNHTETNCQVISNFREYAVPALTFYHHSGSAASFREARASFPSTDPWCQVRIYPMYYMQPADVQKMDCAPGDADYTLGITGPGGWRSVGLGRQVLTARNPDGSLKYPCGEPLVNRSFRQWDLDTARDHATYR